MYRGASLIITLALGLRAAERCCAQGAAQWVFPQPREIAARGSSFFLAPDTRIVAPMDASAPDLALARMLQGELAAKHVLGVPIERRDVLPGGHPVILIGGPRNPLVTEYCHRHNVGA
jgi:hypothetical protein